MDRMIEHAVVIAAEPAEVFAALADPAVHLAWRPSAVEFRTLGGEPVALGTKLEEIVRFAGRRYRTIYAVTAFDPPRLFAIRTLEGPVPLDLRCTLAPAAGGTRLTFWLDARPGLPRPARPVLRLVMHWYLADEARRLKRLVEARAGSA